MSEESNDMIEFRVHGMIATKGSFMALMPKGGKRPIAVPMNDKKLRTWEKVVASTARACIAKNSGRRILAPIPVRISMSFIFQRPKAHFLKNGSVSPTAPIGFHTSRKDIDKIIRATLDGLIGIAFDDDSQVADLHACKVWGNVPLNELGESTVEGVIIRAWAANPCRATTVLLDALY